jgi:hypothetical protein
MKILKVLLIAILVMLTVTPSMAQKKNRKKKDKITALKLYEGPLLSAEEQVRIITVNEKKKYAYFIEVDGNDIPGNSLMNGAKGILLLPGEHKIQLRFVSKGQIAIPIEPFDLFSFEAGKEYLVKFEYIHGKGSYPSNLEKTSIKLWIEEKGKAGVLMEKIVNGYGIQIK